MKKYSKILITLMILTLNVSNIFGFINPNFNLKSEATVIYNLDYDQIVLDVNGDERLYPASITKIMTALVILNNTIDYDDTVTITSEMLAGLRAANAACVGYAAGEVVTVKDLLYGLLLPSGADAANALAFYNSNQIDGFVNEMNRMADKLGCTNTQFMNPTGLDDVNNYTTAKDLVLIFNAALQYDIFKEIIATKEYTSTPTPQHPKGIYMKSSDYMLFEDDEYYSPYVQGGKTGYTVLAQRTFISYGTTDNGLSYIVVSLKAPFEGYYVKSKCFEDQQQIYEWLNEHFSTMTLRRKGDNWNTYRVLHSKTKKFDALLETDLTVLVDDTMQANEFTLNERVLDIYEATLYENQFIGYLDAVNSNGELVSRINLVCNQDIHRSTLVIMGEQLWYTITTYWIQLLVIIFILFVLFFILSLKNYENEKRKAQARYTKRRLKEINDSKRIKP